MDDFLDFLKGVIIASTFILFYYFCLYQIEKPDQISKIEIIKKTQNYSVYDYCHYIDKKYYCYNNIEESDGDNIDN